MSTTEKQHLVNEEIICNKIMLLDEHGERLGMFSNRDAQNKALDVGLDLVQVSANENQDFVVCKIFDFKKFKYAFEKAKHKNEIKNKHHEVKEMHFRISIDPHDISLKVKKCAEFLSKGHKVKIVVEIRGRENSNVTGIDNFISNLTEKFKEIGEFETEPKRETRNIIFFVKPHKIVAKHKM